MSEEMMIQINFKFMEDAEKVISAFFWDDIDYAKKSFNFFQRKIEEIVEEKEVNEVNVYDLAWIFFETCDFDEVHYKEPEHTPFVFRKYLKRLGVSLKDSEHKGFESSGELYSDLWSMGAILCDYKIDLYCAYDDCLIGIARQEDSDLIDNWCDEVGIELNRAGMRRR